MTQGRHGARSSQNPSNPIIKQLLDARLEHQLPIDALAKKAGYSSSALSDWEAERRFPTFHALNDWAQALGFELQLTVRG